MIHITRDEHIVSWT